MEELQKEMDALKQNRDSDIQLAVGGMVLQYEQRLLSEQSRAQAQQTTIAELQGQIQALQESLSSQRDLPSVPSMGATQEEENLRDQIFNYVPGTVNTKMGAAAYDSPDQPYSFQNHIRFRDRPNQPDLESDVTGPGITSTSPTTVPMQLPTHSSTPFCGVSQGPMNKTSDISGISPTNFGAAQDTATIAAEVLAAAVAQKKKEFRHMLEPKITKLRSGFSADAELLFRSWWVDILANIQEGGYDEANLLAEFYSHRQKIKESEEAFPDELQILARKVIIKKPDFKVNLDMTLKQRYASQLLDHNSVSLAKTLLVQMSQCSFTEFCNELAQVLDTCCRAISKASANPLRQRKKMKRMRQHHHQNLQPNLQ